MLPMSEHGIKNEMRMYDNGRLFPLCSLPTNMNQEMMSYTPTSYEQQMPDTVQNSAYNAKISRLEYVTSPKMSTQQETGYSKYNTGLFLINNFKCLLIFVVTAKAKNICIQSSVSST